MTLDDNGAGDDDDGGLVDDIGWLLLQWQPQ